MTFQRFHLVLVGWAVALELGEEAEVGCATDVEDVEACTDVGWLVDVEAVPQFIPCTQHSGALSNVQHVALINVDGGKCQNWCYYFRRPGSPCETAWNDAMIATRSTYAAVTYTFCSPCGTKWLLSKNRIVGHVDWSTS